jgi:hypothetical protein
MSATEKLIELKLASGMTAPDRLKDLADVQELIKIRGLSRDFAEKLDPMFVKSIWNYSKLSNAAGAIILRSNYDHTR